MQAFVDVDCLSLSIMKIRSGHVHNYIVVQVFLVTRSHE